MWGTIETFLDETVVPDQVDGADLAAGYKCLGRFGQLVNSMTGVFDAGGSYDADMALTCAAWLREYVPMTPNGAQRTVARARRLRQLPVLAALAASGELSEAHVDIVLAHVTAKTSTCSPNTTPSSSPPSWRCRSATPPRRCANGAPKPKRSPTTAMNATTPASWCSLA